MIVTCNEYHCKYKSGVPALSCGFSVSSSAGESLRERSLREKGLFYPKIWRCSWKIQFLENTTFKTLEHLSKVLCFFGLRSLIRNKTNCGDKHDKKTHLGQQNSFLTWRFVCFDIHLLKLTFRIEVTTKFKLKIRNQLTITMTEAENLHIKSLG